MLDSAGERKQFKDGLKELSQAHERLHEELIPSAPLKDRSSFCQMLMRSPAVGEKPLLPESCWHNPSKKDFAVRPAQ
jgi:hypothetical protein